MNPENITVTDALGEQASLSQCVILCARSGPMDYSDPTGFLLPGTSNYVSFDDLCDVQLHDDNGEPVDPSEIDWEAS
jgi:hypothetical protein